MNYGFVFDVYEVWAHKDPAIQQLSGQPVAIFPDTVQYIDGYRYVDVMACHIPNVKPVTLRAGLLICNNPPSEMPQPGITVHHFLSQRPDKFVPQQQGDAM